MLARALEAGGVATTTISMVREHTEKTKPPRALFVPFPFGCAMGRPNDPELQHQVLRAALDLLAEPAGPVLRDFPDDAEPGDQPPAPVQASGIPTTAGVPEDPALETTQMRRYHEQWLAASGGRTAFGLSDPATRVPRRRRFLQPSRPGGRRPRQRAADVPLPTHRYCADDWDPDFEGHMAMKRLRAAMRSPVVLGGDAAGQLLRGPRPPGRLRRHAMEGRSLRGERRRHQR